MLNNTHTIAHTLCASGSATPDESTIGTYPRFITASCLYSRPHTLTTGSSAGSLSNGTNKRYPPSGSTSVGTGYGFWDGVNDTLRVDQPITPFAAPSPWDAGNISGKYPFYNSYADYILEMKQIGKDYSVLPEYRMSDRVEDYLLNDVDPFNDTNFLSLTGALADQTTSNKSEFYKIYSHSDFMKYFDVTETKMSDKVSAQAARLKVRCSAMLKLLPYDGFYPASRTVQLYELFSSSYGKNLSLTGSNSHPSVPGTSLTDRLGTMAQGANAYIRPFITPMFAPGILFNTIKSGIAVDFPCLTGSTVLTASAITGADARLTPGGSAFDLKSNWLIVNKNFNYRVPFEALIEPETHMANVVFLDMEPHPSAAIDATASWDGNGDRRYRKAMHNFLAEVPEFFLKDGTFTSFASSPSNNWNFEKGKTYKMRVQIRKSIKDRAGTRAAFGPSLSLFPQTEYNNLVDPHIPQVISGSETFVMYDRPTAFGPPSKGARLLHRSVNQAGTLHAGVGGGSLYGYNAPFTPPYYDGAAWVDLEVTPGFESPTFDELIQQITSSYLRYSGYGGGSWTTDADSILVHKLALV